METIYSNKEYKFTGYTRELKEINLDIKELHVRGKFPLLRYDLKTPLSEYEGKWELHFDGDIPQLFWILARGEKEDFCFERLQNISTNLRVSDFAARVPKEMKF